MILSYANFAKRVTCAFTSRLNVAYAYGYDRISVVVSNYVPKVNEIILTFNNQRNDELMLEFLIGYVVTYGEISARDISHIF